MKEVLGHIWELIVQGFIHNQLTWHYSLSTEKQTRNTKNYFQLGPKESGDFSRL